MDNAINEKLNAKSTFYANEILKAKDSLANIEHELKMKQLNLNHLMGARQAILDMIEEMKKGQ